MRAAQIPFGRLDGPILLLLGCQYEMYPGHFQTAYTIMRQKREQKRVAKKIRTMKKKEQDICCLLPWAGEMLPLPLASDRARAPFWEMERL